MTRNSTYSPLQTVPIPDCPTPDSVHSGTESVTSTSFSAISPVLAKEVEASSATNQAPMLDSVSSPQYPFSYLSSSIKAKNQCNKNIYTSPLFDSALSKTSFENESLSSIEYSKTTSSKSKGKTKF